MSHNQQKNAQTFFAVQYQKLEKLFDFAQEQDQLWEILKIQSGDTLDYVISKIPDMLKGLVEIYYLHGTYAGYRMIEALLYQSKIYDPSLQTLLLYKLNDDNRNFVLTTPRLDSSDYLFLNIPHHSSIIDELSKAKINGINDINEFALHCNVLSDQHELFCSFFEKTSEESKANYKEKITGTQVRYFGHACVEMKTQNVSILVDPVISYKLPASNDDRYTYNDLPNYIDGVVITHLHLDHFCIETLLQIRYKVGKVIVPKTMGGTSINPSPLRILKAIGFNNIVEMEAFDQLSIGDFHITAIPFQGEHGDLNIDTKLTYKICSVDVSCLFTADTRLLDLHLLQRISNLVGDINILYMGMECEGAPVSWVYGSLLDEPITRAFDQNRRLNGSNCQQAIQLVDIFKPKHVNVYALGREPWLSHIMKVNSSADSIGNIEIEKFVEACKLRGISTKTLYIANMDHYIKTR